MSVRKVSLRYHLQCKHIVSLRVMLLFLTERVYTGFSVEAGNDARLSYREKLMYLLRVRLSAMLLKNRVAVIAYRTLTQC